MIFNSVTKIAGKRHPWTRYREGVEGEEKDKLHKSTLLQEVRAQRRLDRKHHQAKSRAFQGHNYNNDSCHWNSKNKQI
jgi:hypothetical protein